MGGRALFLMPVWSTTVEGNCQITELESESLERAAWAYLGSPECLQGQLLSFWGRTGQQSYQTFVHLVLVFGITMDQRIQEDLNFFLSLF